MTAVRVRGIYTTALTRRFHEAGLSVVQASPPIRRRFDAEFERRAYDATVETTDGRQGVGVHGDPDAVERVTSLLAEVGVDAFAWTDDAPRGAVFDAPVEETLGRGAVVALTPDREGFLPYARVDDRVEEGDVLRVQVHEASAPWRGGRAVVGTELRAVGGLATLSTDVDAVTVETRDDAAGQELAGLTDLLPTDRPEEWGLRWGRDAVDADMETLSDALADAAARAESIDAALAEAGDVDAPRRVAAPERTSWVWFGRESRFALDDDRRAVTATMAGHHRIKAAREAASAAVDFAESVCTPGDEFPAGAVFRQFGPDEGDSITIGHGKPDGRLITLGRGRVTECDPAAGTLTLRRKMSAGGSYDALGIEREQGDTATTKLKEGRWWYPTTYRSADGEVKGTYVNVCTPVELFPDTARYVDLHVDVVKHPDGAVERVDDDELDAAVAAGHVAADLAEKARSVAGAVTRALE